MPSRIPKLNTRDDGTYVAQVSSETVTYVGTGPSPATAYADLVAVLVAAVDRQRQVDALTAERYAL